MPSGSVFAALAAHQYPASKALLILYMLASGYSQVYVGNHYAFDVFGGIIMGTAAGHLLLGTLYNSDNHPAMLSISLPID